MHWSPTSTRVSILVLAVAVLGALVIAPARCADAPPSFTPPDEAARRAAIGPGVERLPEALRRALDPTPFRPIAVPGPADWLARFAEPGQDFAEFARAGSAKPDAQRRTIDLVPIDAFDPALSPDLELLRRFTAAYFALPTRIVAPLDAIALGVTERRNPNGGERQMLTGDLLDALAERRADDAFVTVGVTMTDLYPADDWNYVFGQAVPAHGVGVFSFARYRPEVGRLDDAGRRLLAGRSARVLAHEIGHLFGIDHCIWFACVMNGSNHLDEADAQPLEPCPVDLRKLQLAVGFDVEVRRRALDQASAALGLDAP